jgi:hypothetical protein
MSSSLSSISPTKPANTKVIDTTKVSSATVTPITPEVIEHLTFLGHVRHVDAKVLSSDEKTALVELVRQRYVRLRTKYMDVERYWWGISLFVSNHACDDMKDEIKRNELLRSIMRLPLPGAKLVAGPLLSSYLNHDLETVNRGNGVMFYIRWEDLAPTVPTPRPVPA